VSYLIVALAAPVLGPILYATLHGQDRAVRLVDRFVYVAVPALVAWQVLPFAIDQRSAVVIVAVVAGLLIPTVFERASRSMERHADDLAIAVGLSGLVIHAALEGAAFAPLGAPVDPAFGLAVVLHRVPVGLIIWWLLRPRHGIPAAAAGVGSLVVATLLGVILGGELLGAGHGPGAKLYQAFVSGSLMHVVFHQGRHDHNHGDHGDGQEQVAARSR